MNEKLKFSWFNILTFLALIAIAYTGYVGLTYMTNGDFITAGIGTAIIIVLLAAYFMILQNIKATAFYLKRRLRIEVVMLVLSPVVFAILVIPCTHFWTVTAQDDLITKSFRQSINGATGLFTDYEEYCNKRLLTLHNNLLTTDQGFDTEKKHRLGLDRANNEMHIENMENVLRLQLLSPNYYNLRDAALKWIKQSDTGASTWNVFLLGNTREIKASIGQWETDLKKMADHRMQAEDMFNTSTKFESTGAADAITGIENLTEAFTGRRFPNFNACIFCLIVYLMLILPYIFQSRNARSAYRLTDIFSDKPKQAVDTETGNTFSPYDEDESTIVSAEKRGRKAEEKSGRKSNKNVHPQEADDEFDENGGFTLD